MSRHKAIFKSIRQLSLTALDAILPPRCIGSGDIVDVQGNVSPAFWSELSFVSAPYCDCCGLPFSFDAAEGSLCAGCIETEPLFDRARAAVIYTDASRQAVLDFKYGDRLHAVKTFTPWMIRAGGSMIGQADVVVPVPLHWKRLWSRRFNQSALLAAAIARASNRKYLPDSLRRGRHTVPQKGLSRSERRENIKNAFSVPPARKDTIDGKTILLIDDVFTSGATLNECARTLKNSGADKVFILTIARVTRDEHFSL